mgnify:CR=1 FL=1|jgi:hypothetical protein
MATINLNQATEVVHQAAAQLAKLDWIDQEAAQQLGPLAEAVANMFMVLYYQAETGLASQADFAEALATVRQHLMH